MKPLNNKVIIAAAGSGKSSDLVDKALHYNDKRILITTFTIDNTKEIEKKFFDKLGYIPKNVVVQTWYSFLLRECVRPYQNLLYEKKRIENIEFVNGQSTRYVAKKDIENYYFRDGKYIYTDKLCDFILEVNSISGGLVIERLESIYDIVMIDEVQDLAGTDLDFLYLLLKSNIHNIIVGDNRQATYFTNNSRRNKKYRGQTIFDLFSEWREEGLCSIEYKTDCFRCNQLICDIADSLYPEMPKTTSLNGEQTGHDGVFYIRSSEVFEYVKKYSPVVLRYDKRTKNIPEIYSPLNFGKSKGLTFDRVLIYPNGPVNKFLKGDYKAVSSPKTKAGLYVALTRARYSVVFVTDQKMISNELVKGYTLSDSMDVPVYT
ncbi:UvrD-helicase domain-containing protein [Evansella halocellulosilytica]|uniref:UvrD-helicase domain-containing protein n=1 Tax=Evansella halocellulosilytica TaxID=2011013 RepID=UPI000BB8C79A|nr:UvrD-helicase domain-containing protein [Evansella halocellulosilytica]